MWHHTAEREWISGVSLRAVAHDDVVYHVTFCSRATLARTRVPALVVVTILVPWAVRIQDTFRFTPAVRVPVILVTADTNSDAVLIGAISICSAR